MPNKNIDTKDEERKVVKEVLHFIKDIIIIFAIVFSIKMFVIENTKVNWRSMMSTFYDTEFILVNKIGYILWTPERWDVIAASPKPLLPKKSFLKRVVWMPEDTIKFSWWKVFIKTKTSEYFIELQENYLDDNNKNKTFIRNRKNEDVEFIIPEWKYFLMWDNRNNSSDSRTCFGSNDCDTYRFIAEDDLKGHVVLSLWHYDAFRIKEFRYWTFDWTVPLRLTDIDASWEYPEIK